MRAAMVAAAAAGAVTLAAGCAGSAAHPAATPKQPNPSPGSTATQTVTAPPPSTVTQTASPSNPPAGFSAAFAHEHTGVVRITESTCSGIDQGTGFLVAPNLVATAAHVVDGETALQITDPGGTSTSGQVVGFDAAHDVALVRTQASLSGFVFGFATADPPVGSPIAAIGYPLNGPESIVEGLVSGLGRTIMVENGRTLSGMIQTDTSLNPGNSGGPMIAMDGTVEGIADAGTANAPGINYAVSATQAAPLVDTWLRSPTPVPPASCQTPAPVPTQTQTPGATPSTAIDDAVAALNHYIDLINAQDYRDAYALLTSSGQQRAGSEPQWAQGLAGSFYANPQIVDFHSLPGGGFDVEVTFTSTQPGQSCKNWDLDFHMLPGQNGGYLIDIALPHDGGSGFTPC